MPMPNNRWEYIFKVLMTSCLHHVTQTDISIAPIQTIMGCYLLGGVGDVKGWTQHTHIPHTQALSVMSACVIITEGSDIK